MFIFKVNRINMIFIRIIAKGMKMNQLKETETKCGLCFFFLIIFLFSASVAEAQNKVAVIPLFSDDAPSCTCEGLLSSGGRWCDNGDGTVTDMTTCLVWLKDADCSGQMNWYVAITSTIEELRDGECGLSDGSIWGDWRLPKLSELEGITQGSEAVSASTPRFFNDVQLTYYWSCTRQAGSDDCIWLVIPGVGSYTLCDRNYSYYVLPVRSY